MPAVDHIAPPNETAPADQDFRAGERWLAHMRRGHFEEAWKESDAIRARGAHDPHRFWTGEAIDGRHIMLRSLHGFGDAVQMLRYVPQLRRRAASLVVEVAPHLLPLARFFDGIDEVITWGEDGPSTPPHWDLQLEVMELPYLFRTQIRDLPLATQYLHPPAANDLHTGAGDEGTLRVGLVWSSGSWNPSRSIPPHLISPLLQTPGCTFWNLQGADATHDGAVLERNANLRTDPECAHSLVRLAQLIQAMDLIITPDTLAAHLAGALAKPAWVLLEHQPDWRWMLDRDDSPWYPSLKLFRQQRPGDWQTTLAAVQEQLASMASAHMQRTLESNL